MDTASSVFLQTDVLPEADQLKEFLHLLEVCTHAIQYSESPEATLSMIFGSEAQHLLGFRKGYVAGIDVLEGTFHFVAILGREAWESDGDFEILKSWVGSKRPTATPQGRLVRSVMRHKRSYITEDYSTDEAFSPELRRSLKLNAVMVSPFVVADEALGLLLLDYPSPPPPKTQWMRERLVAYAAVPAIQAFWVQRLRKEAELAIAWQILGQQAGALAHDLKTPIATLRNGLTSLSRLTRGNSGAQRTIQRARKQVYRIEGTVANLLAFVRSIDLKLTKTSVGDLISFSLKASNPAATNANVIGDHLDRQVMVDRDKASLALRNIINNALEAPLPDGVNDHAVTIEVLWKGDEYAICICDNGTGASEEVRREMFNPTYSTKKHGHGLGLAVAQRFVTKHGGRILVRDSPLGGLCFDVFLPVTPRISNGGNEA